MASLRLFALIVVIVGTLFPRVALASCGTNRASDNVSYVTHLLRNYYSTNYPINVACEMAVVTAPKVLNDLIYFGLDDSLSKSTDYIYNQIHTGRYMSEVFDAVSGRAIIGRSAVDGAKRVVRTVLSSNRNNVNKWFFQTTVVAPYFYNVGSQQNNRILIHNSRRYYPDGTIKNGCGYLLCQ